MEKDFESWCPLKVELNSVSVNELFHELEIWWCSLGVNIVDEEDGKGMRFARPVLVFKKLGKHIFLGIPLSSILKNNYLYCNFEFKNTKQSAIIGQIRVMDSKRLEEKMGRVSKTEFNKIKEELKKLLF